MELLNPYVSGASVWAPFASGMNAYGTLLAEYWEGGIEELDGASVTTWHDTSGNDLDLTSSNSSDTVVAVVGGYKEVAFSNNAFFEELTDSSLLNLIPQTDDFTLVVWVGNSIASTGTNRYIAGRWDTSSASTQSYGFRFSSNDNSNVSVVGGEAELYAGGHITNTVYSFSYDASANRSYQYIAGTDQGDDGHGGNSPSNVSTKGFAIGNVTSGSSTTDFAGNVKGAWIYDAVLNDTAHANINTYLQGL